MSSIPRRTVFVTGLRMVNALERNTVITWDNVLKGKSGIRLIESVDSYALPCQFAVIIKQFTLAPFKTRHGSFYPIWFTSSP